MRRCALALYNSMSKDEKAKAWSKHQVALRKRSEEEREAYKTFSKRDKGVKAAAYLLEKEGKQYMSSVQHGCSSMPGLKGRGSQASPACSRASLGKALWYQQASGAREDVGCSI